MIEKIIRWQIKVFLPGYHLHKDPEKKPTAVVNFPEVKDGQQ